MSTGIWNGARWWKFDFHTHTPASDDYGKGPDQAGLKNRTAREWLLDYMKAGIDCVAVTDHNSGGWIDKLKDEYARMEAQQPEGFRPLHIFPGVEISVYGGIHVLAILDKDKGTSDIDSLLGAAGYNGTKGSCDSVTNRTLNEVAEEITRVGGIAIPAHVDEANGLFKLTGQTLQQAINCEHFFAMELMNDSFAKPAAYSSCKRPWTEIVGSDAHHPTGDSGQKFPGSRFSWIKMGTPSIEGLRLALLDGPLSVLRSDKVSEDPNRHADMVIESIDVENARYIGRPSALCIGLNPWMNAIIGGRGTGKSTLIEFLRIALRREDEIPEELKSEFDKYRQVYTTREESGLLTENAAIKVVYRKDGVAYRIQWDYNGKLDSIQQQTPQGWQTTEGDIRQRFPVRIYSQKQIFQLAKTPRALLRIVDDAPQVDYASWKRNIEAVENQYLSLKAKIREIQTGLAEESRLKGELEDIKHKLSFFEQSGHAEILKSMQKRRRQAQAVDVWDKGISDIGSRLRATAEELIPEDFDDADFDKTLIEDAKFLELIQNIKKSMGDIVSQVSGLANKADAVLADWRKQKDDSSWKSRVDEAMRAYKDLQERLKQEGVADPSGYGQLVQRRQMLENQIKDFENRRKQIADLQKQASGCLEKIALYRKELTQKRRAFLDEVLEGNPYVRITIVPYGAKDEVEETFRYLIQRETGGFEKDIEKLLGNIYSKSPDVSEIERRLAALKNTVHEIVQDPQVATLADKRFGNHLAKLPPEALDRLDLWYPEDSLDVEYSSSADRQTFRPIQEGSPGQKTAALLAFLLSYGTEPLILDQPEDDLDNHLIYDLIVTQLREIKRRRQVIVVTHNANIVVNGDAELVIALVARNGQTQIEISGSLQEKTVRRTICDVMEGGEKAFEQRYRRIALEGRHV
ncbi:MAG TPA: AAA family ATPase [Syntrophorhabdaceae bacterium]|nr:AAA family ATPase [Syntrophorhabdaceae bacterium]